MAETTDYAGAEAEGGDGAGKLPPSAMVKPLSLPDNLLELTRQKEVTILARVMLVATHSGAQDELVREIETLCEGRGTVTGVGLVMRQACMLFCEGRSEAMRDLVLAFKSNLTAKLDDLRVAAFCDDVPSRSYSSFGVMAVNVPKEANLEVPEENMTKFIFESYQRCTLLGKEVGSREVSSALGAIQEKQPALLVSSERIAAIATHNDAMTMDDFFDLHGRPAQPESLGDTIWPMQDIAVDLLR
ncbi:Testis-expressed protein 47 [Hondaea fermentalgiana]|uniref:Testis-expressed protein 47 n=1 Tax=Hondaea fermentalgiana TaxID=2315210 RepID=A0A2R5GFS3_9STRA|nr:Testis-expressed protein 47 [Hondaea fermentalgiana]|eukprot:GBG29159.1 Testis-expressed protein 47 [Hondaea fermentalgiana]